MTNPSAAVSAETATDTSESSRPALPASRLSAWCDRLIEMGWLAAVIIAPLFFNIYSSRVFEPDKLTTVRSIALAMCTLWLIKWLDERNNPHAENRITWRTPLVAPTLILIVVYIISSLLSVAPRTSLLGSYQRLQGTYTYFSYIVIFFMILQGMRTRAQFDRLINTIILCSFPISMYGVIQRGNIDPLPWGGDVTERVAGNMGNSIFIAAYLIFGFFLGAGRIVETLASLVGNKQPRVVDVIRIVILTVITALNAYVIAVLAGSRGPQIGWIAGGYFLVLLLAQLIRSRKGRLVATLSLLGVGAVIVGGFVFINVSKDPLAEKIKAFPMFHRLSSVLQASEGTNLVRKLIWDGNVELMLPHDPIEFPAGTGQAGPDPFNAIRPLVGYGPESMYVAYNRFYPPGLANVEARNASPDRSHNETWDSFVITGALGFLAYIFLFGSLFYFGFKWVGMIAKRRDTILFIATWVIGGILGGIGAVNFIEPAFLGVGIAAGVGIGLATFMIISTVMSALGYSEGALHVRATLRDQILMVAILSAIIAHFAEIHLGIAIASTRTTFFVLAGALVVMGMGWLRDSARVEESAEALDASGQPTQASAPAVAATPAAAPAVATAVATTSAARARRRAQSEASRRAVAASQAGSPTFPLPIWFRGAASDGIVIGLMLGVLAYCFTTNADRLTVPGRVVWNSLTLAKGQPTDGVLLMFLLLLVVGSIFMIGDAHRHGHLSIPSRENAGPLIAATLTSIGIGFFMWVMFATFMAARLTDFISSNQTLESILAIANNLGFFPAWVYLLIALAMVAFAAVNVGREPVWRRGLSSSGLLGLLVLLPVAVASILTSNLQPIRGDIVYKQANPWDQQGANVLQQGTTIQGFDVAIEHYRIAINLAPNEDFYYLWLGRALLEKGKSTPATNVPKTWTTDATKCDWQNNGASAKVLSDGVGGWGRDGQTNPLPSARMAREDLITAACGILTEARVLNPLNTDHTANLARMWRQSADITPATDATLKVDRINGSAREYQTATYLSPNNAQLINEWATLLMYSLGDLAGARAKLERSYATDQKFDQTYLYYGDLNLQEASRIDAQRSQIKAQITAATTLTGTAPSTVNVDALKTQLAGLDTDYLARLKEAQGYFEKGLEIFPYLILSEYKPLALIAQQTGNPELGIKATRAWLEYKEPSKGAQPNLGDYEGLRNVAVWYQALNQKASALEFATRAKQAATNADQNANADAVLAQIKAMP